MKILKLIGMVAAFGLVSQAHAANYYWTNTVEAIWNSDTNWVLETTSVNGIPSSTDSGRITNSGTVLIDDSQGQVFTGFVEAGPFVNPNATTGSVHMISGMLRTSFDIRIGGNSGVGGGMGTFNHSGGDIFMQGGNFNTAQGSNALGTYNISGGSLQVDSGVFFVAGNRGLGIINQTSGDIYVRGGSAPGTAAVQLGRNAVTGTGTGSGMGTYNFSGGNLTTPHLQYGAVVGIAPPGSTNIFNLSGAGTLVVGTISVRNTAASNYFNFTGGTLSIKTTSIQLTNSGGILSPVSMEFAPAPATATAVVTDPIGTNFFTGENSYIQGAGGTLAIDIGGAGFNDALDIGAGALVGTATLEGTIAVTLLNSYNPTLGNTFDIVIADTIASTASVTGSTPDGNVFRTSIVTGGDGRMILRLTVDVPRPQITSSAVVGGSFKLTFSGTTGATYKVLTFTDIATSLSMWTVLGDATETPPNSGQFQFTDPSPATSSQRFYVVRLN